MQHNFFRDDELPAMATHCPQQECGFSIYAGVLVRWDEDHDERILHVLDAMPNRVLMHLLVCQEHEGSVSFVWDCGIPPGFTDQDEIEVPGGDVWCIHSSVIARGR